MTPLAELLPTFNAICNSLCASCVVLGYFAIRKLHIRRHQRLMTAAVCFSALFLAGYLTRYYLVGVTRFGGQGIWRPIYFTILLTHTMLAIVCTPLVLTTFILGVRGRIERHRRLAKITLPIWLYVSITGVVIYFFLFQWFV